MIETLTQKYNRVKFGKVKDDKKKKIEFAVNDENANDFKRNIHSELEDEKNYERYFETGNINYENFNGKKKIDDNNNIHSISINSILNEGDKYNIKNNAFKDYNPLYDKYISSKKNNTNNSTKYNSNDKQDYKNAYLNYYQDEIRNKDYKNLNYQKGTPIKPIICSESELNINPEYFYKNSKLINDNYFSKKHYSSNAIFDDTKYNKFKVVKNHKNTRQKNLDFFSRLRNYLTKFNFKEKSENYDKEKDTNFVKKVFNKHDNSHFGDIKKYNIFNEEVKSQDTLSEFNNISKTLIDRNDEIDDAVSYKRNLILKLEKQKTKILNEEIHKLQKLLNDERNQMKKVIDNYEKKIIDLNIKNSEETETLNNKINFLNENNLLKNAKLEKKIRSELLVKFQDLADEQNEKEIFLENLKSELQKKIEDLEIKEKHFENYKVVLDLKNIFFYSRESFKFEKQHLFQDQLKLNLKIDQFKRKYEEDLDFFKKKSIHYDKFPEKFVYKKIKQVFENESIFLKKIIESIINKSFFGDDLEKKLLETETFFYDIKESLVNSKFKKNQKIKILKQNFSTINKFSSLNIKNLHKYYKKILFLLNDQKLINNLLNQIFHFFQISNDIKILKNFSSKNVDLKKVYDDVKLESDLICIDL